MIDTTPESIERIVRLACAYRLACDMARHDMSPYVSFPSRPENKEDFAREWAMKAKRTYDELTKALDVDG